MTGERQKDSDGLDVFFDAARKGPGPSDDLMARVLADAAAVQAQPAAKAGPVRRRSGLIEAIGGWIAVSGLAAACATGVAVGAVLPASLDTTTGVLSGLVQDETDAGFADFGAIAFASDFEVGQ